MFERNSKLAHTLLACVLLLGVFLRVRLATATGYLYDEIVFVDWIGQWFSHHLLEYIFQFQHTHFPPQSPSFSNPPFAMYFYGVAIAGGRAIGIHPLLAARLVNVACFPILGISTYALARRWLTRAAALVAVSFLTILPAMVLAGATAYVEQIAVTWSIIAILCLTRYCEHPSPKMLIALIVCTALALLSKLSVAPYAAIIFVTLAVQAYRKRIPRFAPVAFPLGILAFAVISWAGARDVAQLTAAYSYVVSRRDAPALPSPYPRWFKLFYYPLMVFGTQSAVTALACAIAMASALIDAARRRLSRDTAFAWLALIVVLLPLSFLVGFSTRHQITVVLPLLAIALAFGSDRLLAATWFRTLPNSVKAASGILFALLALSPFASPPACWPAFTNVLVGRLRSEALFATGDGDLLDRVGAWINEKTPHRAKIGSLYGVYILEKYVESTHSIVPVFEGDTWTNLTMEKLDYIVVPRDVLSFVSFPLQRVLANLAPAAVINVCGQPYYYIYAIHPRLSVVSGPLLLSGRDQKGTDARVDERLARNALRAFVSGRVKFAGDGITVQFRTNHMAQFYVDLMDSAMWRYRRFQWPSLRDSTLFIPYSAFSSPKDVPPITFTDLQAEKGVVRVVMVANERALHHVDIRGVSMARVANR